VLLAGITTGTALLVTACWAGWRPRIPALPPFLAAITGTAVAWLAFVSAASLAAGLLRRHHKALARHAARQARRGTLATARAAGKGSRSLGGWLAATAARRWQAREHVPPFLTRRPAAAGNDPAPAGTPVPVIAAASLPPGRASAPAPAAAPPKGDLPMTTPDGPPVPRARHGASPRNAPAEWKPLVAATAGFEPADDGELLEWMASEVAGMSAYAEALTEVYETCVNSLGVDPAAMNAVHDTADAAADAATAMAYARQKFAAHYAEVREFAASGGLLPYDGRWITGEGDT